MREIKFRAYFIGIGDDPVVARDSDEECYTNVGVALMQWLADAKTYAGKIEIVQYTGLKDKNGKEIYEGDIITFRGRIYKVNARSGCFMADWVMNGRSGEGHSQDEVHVWHTLFDWKHLIEVIGNIHENPELLEANQ